MSISIVRSALICERPRGAGKGRKICGNCRYVNPSWIQACKCCGGEFYTAKPRAVRVVKPKAPKVEIEMIPSNILDRLKLNPVFSR